MIVIVYIDDAGDLALYKAADAIAAAQFIRMYRLKRNEYTLLEGTVLLSPAAGQPSELPADEYILDDDDELHINDVDDDNVNNDVIYLSPDEELINSITSEARG